jgi:hypothetical protein
MQFEPIGAEVLGPTITIVATGIISVLIVGIVQWRKLRQMEMENGLKQMMLERGMSADEIVQVLSASSGRSPTNQPVSRREWRDRVKL